MSRSYLPEEKDAHDDCREDTHGSSRKRRLREVPRNLTIKVHGANGAQDAADLGHAAGEDIPIHRCRLSSPFSVCEEAKTMTTI